MVWDPVWEEVFRSQAWGKYPGEDLIRFVARNFYAAPERSAVRILEVGCGPGANLWFMAREGFAVYGIDGSATAIETARARLNSECPGWRGELHCGDISVLPFAAESFDAVIDHEAVYCNEWGTSRAIYHEMARVTKPGGKLFVRTFATGSWGDETGLQAGPNAWVAAEGPLKGKGYSRFTSLQQLPDLLHGFDLDEIEQLSRTAADRTKIVSEWLVCGTKRGGQ